EREYLCLGVVGLRGPRTDTVQKPGVPLVPAGRWCLPATTDGALGFEEALPGVQVGRIPCRQTPLVVGRQDERELSNHPENDVVLERQKIPRVPAGAIGRFHETRPDLDDPDLD